MPDFADLACLMPITLPTHKCMFVKDLPTLPTFNAHARIREKKLNHPGIYIKEKSLHARVVGRQGRQGRQIIKKQMFRAWPKVGK